jgi:hypothetical protein
MGWHWVVWSPDFVSSSGIRYTLPEGHAPTLKMAQACAEAVFEHVVRLVMVELIEKRLRRQMRRAGKSTRRTAELIRSAARAVHRR